MFRRITTSFSFLCALTFSADCPSSLRAELQQGHFTWRIHQQGFYQNDEKALQDWLRAQSHPNKKPTRSLLRVEIFRPLHETPYLISLSAWTPALLEEGGRVWAPCWDRWIWESDPTGNILHDLQILTQQLHNSLRMNHDPKSTILGTCPIPGFCPRLSTPPANASGEDSTLSPSVSPPSMLGNLE